MPKAINDRSGENRMQIFIKEKDGEFLIVGVWSDHDIYFIGTENKLPEACEQAKQLAGKIGIAEKDIHVLGMDLPCFLLIQSAAKGGDADEFPCF